MPATRTIEQSIVLDAPRDDVFRALTDADALNSWWTTSARSDPRPGGAFVYDWEFEDASRNHRQQGEYIDVEPGRAISYPWAAGGETTVSFRLADADGGTEVKLTHSGFSADDEVYANHDGGWGHFLANLKSVLEGGPDGRVAIGLKVPARKD
jgi:uncharacterized protein YndB with AHSA1/START domain